MAHVIIVSAPVKKNWFWGLLDLGVLGQGIGDLDWGLKIEIEYICLTEIDTVVQ